MAKNKAATGQIRIIAGQWRSRRLPILDLEGLRPTTDRVRETLFNWLSGEISGARVLDCFAGSGALALESLSRYASYARVFELQKSAAMQLAANLKTLKCDNADVITTDCLAALKQGLLTTYQLRDSQPEKGFDIVFIDPPFRRGLAQAAVTLLSEKNVSANHWLNANALIYVETEIELTSFICPDNWQQLKEKKAGQVCYRLYRYVDEQA